MSHSNSKRFGKLNVLQYQKYNLNKRNHRHTVPKPVVRHQSTLTENNCAGRGYPVGGRAQAPSEQCCLGLNLISHVCYHYTLGKSILNLCFHSWNMGIIKVWLILIHRFHICKFVHLIKFVCNSQINTQWCSRDHWWTLQAQSCISRWDGIKRGQNAWHPAFFLSALIL
jgi:hypothetical protein